MPKRNDGPVLLVLLFCCAFALILLYVYATHG